MGVFSNTFGDALVQLGANVNVNAFVKTLADRLKAGTQPATILVQGDSTGNESTEWVYKISEWIAAKYPAYTTDYRLWNDTKQHYDDAARIYEAAAGNGYAVYSGVGGEGNYFEADVNTTNIITGDVEVIGKVASANYSLVSDRVIIGKFGGGGFRSFVFGINNRYIFYWWSNDGSANTYKKSTVQFTAADNEAIWLKATHDVNNGAGGNTIKFYTSDDGIGWTQLGDDIINEGITSIYPAAYAIQVGAKTSGSDVFYGKIYKAIIRNGISGVTVADPDFGQAFPSTIDRFPDTCGNTFIKHGDITTGNGSPQLLILNASVSGQNLAYFNDIARFGKTTPIESQLSFISLSHNEGADTDIQTEYEALCTKLLTKYASTGVVCVAQNPEVDTEPNYAAHATRCAQIKSISSALGYGFVGVYDKIFNTGNVELYVVGVHPNEAGTALWVDETKKFMSGI